jgi:3-deoxy-manno-octulosonate cytidylyltransferase (CMP-KDO synthetase)
MYASRAPIPSNKKNEFIKAFRQVCIYAFPAEALKNFSAKKKTFFENIEDIEYLRFLEKGYKLKCILLSGKSISVDTPNDLKKVKKKIIN